MKKSDLITTICTGVAFGNILILIFWIYIGFVAADTTHLVIGLINVLVISIGFDILRNDYKEDKIN